jgi:hypothetical protein
MSAQLREVIDELGRRQRAGDLDALIVVFKTKDGSVADRTAGDAAEPLMLLIMQALVDDGRAFFLAHNRRTDSERRPSLRGVEDAEPKEGS